MFQPVGSEPPSVYWRRRVMLLVSVIAMVILLVITVRVVFSDGGSSSAATGGTGSTTRAPSTPAVSSPRATSSAASNTASGSSSTVSGSTSGRASSSVPPAACSKADLGLAAATEQSRYAVGAQPVLSILVTNKSDAACVQDLADPQIVLRVYNGESRVWGSHDCKVEPGTDDRTLMPGTTVRVSIVWSGLTSQPKCAGHRQRVGAGTYTVYASLAGHEGRAAQFTIS